MPVPYSKYFLIISIIVLIIPLGSAELTALERTAELYHSGEYEKAIDHLQVFIEENAGDEEKADLFRHQAFLFKEKGEMSDYADRMQKAMELKPDDEGLKLETAVALYQTAKREEASILFDELIIALEDGRADDLDKTEIKRAYFYQGKNALARGKLNKARSSWLEGLSRQKSPQFYVALGELKEQSGEKEPALTYYEKALDEDGSLNYLYPRKAEIYEEKEEYRHALNYWQKSLRTGILPEEAEENIERIENMLPAPVPEEREDHPPEVEVPWQPEWSEVREVPEFSDIPRVRVRLGESRHKALIAFDSNFTVRTENNNRLISGEEEDIWRISMQEGDFLLQKEDSPEKRAIFPADEYLTIESSQESSSFMIQNVAYGQDYYWAGSEDRQYRGKLILSPQKDEGKFIMINELNLEEYLLSVVPAEMPSYWPEEALKAQALAVRSYALSNLENRHSGSEYDLCDTVHCQVYEGVNSEAETSSSAVQQTAGEVGIYEDEIITAVYSSNSGGHTGASEEIWGGELSYLTGENLQLEAEYEFPLLPGDLQDWHLKDVRTFSGPGGYTSAEAYRWIREVDAEFLRRQFDLAEIEDIIVESRTPAGYINSLKIRGGADNIILSGDTIRSSLGGLRSNKFFLHRELDSEGNFVSVILHGAGWGHGVGMDQTAAANMAAAGLGYREIFTNFYHDIDIEKIY